MSIEWLPFFLNPNMKPEGEDIREHLAKKYGPEAAAKFGQPGNSLYVAGDKVGIKFNPDRRVVPTMDCHRAIEWCKKEYKDEDGKYHIHNVGVQSSNVPSIFDDVSPDEFVPSLGDHR